MRNRQAEVNVLEWNVDLVFGIVTYLDISLTLFVCFLLGDSPASVFYAPTFRNTVCSIFTGRQVDVHARTCLWRWNRQSVPKRRHIKFRRRGITQKKAYDIQDTKKVWNQEYLTFVWYTGLFISPSGTSELDCATTKTDTAERSISIGRESLKVFLY